MKNKFVKLSKLAVALSLSLVAGAVSAQSDSFAGRVAAFGTPAVNTGVLLPGLLGGITINGQVTHPNVFVFPAANQQWFTTVRTCFNPLEPLAGIELSLLVPAASTVTSLITNLINITGTAVPVLGTGLTGVANLLAGVLAPIASTSMTVNYTVYNDAGTAVKTLSGVSIPANGCDTHTSDVTSDPLFLGVAPGLYTVIANAPLLQNLLGLNLGFLTGSSNSTGRDVLKALNMLPESHS